MPYAARPPLAARLAANLAANLALALALALLPALPARAAETGTETETGNEAGTETVADAEALATALAAAGPGTTLSLAGGDYGGLFVKGLTGAAGAPVTLRSADPGDPARFGAMGLREAAHVVLEGLVFDYVYQPGDRSDGRPFQVLDSRDVTIRKTVFDGDRPWDAGPVDATFGTGLGLFVRFSEEILIENCEIRDFHRATLVSQSQGIRLLDNDIHTNRMDGLTFAEVRHVLIEGNTIRDFNRSLESGDHADMIQFWTQGTKTPSSDITIRGNLLSSGRGWYTQSIFMRNEEVDQGRAGREMFYRHITIEDNVILNAHLHGITLGETDGLVIRHNTLIRNAASAGKDNNPELWTPRINISSASEAVRIERNAMSEISGAKERPDWVVKDNLQIQDRFASRPGYYDKVFVAARTGDPETLAAFAYLPGGPLDGTGIGAPRLGALPPPETITPQIRVAGDAAARNRFRFDASLSTGPAAALQGARIAWDFGDGNSASGAVAEHSYAGPGPRTVTLTLTGADGVPHKAETTLAVDGPEVLSFDATTGRFTAWAAGEGRTVWGDAPGPVPLGQGRPPIEIDRGAIAAFFGAGDFDIALRLRAVGPKAAGELLRIHTSLLVTLTGTGGVEMRIDPETGPQIALRTGPLRLLNGKAHDIGLRYSAASGLAQIVVNGRVVAEAQGSGVLKPMQHWGLALGNPFGQGKSFDGVLESLHLQANTEAFAEVP